MTENSETETKPNAGIQGGLSLDGSAENICAYYQQWAANYDSDVDDGGYVGAKITVDCFLQAWQHLAEIDKYAYQIHDVGCGTGLVGKFLSEQDFTYIHGSDLTPNMAVLAQQRGVYQQVVGGTDITQPICPEWVSAYDAVLSSGVFTSGHVPPETLLQLKIMVKIGGLIVISTREQYYKAMNYQQLHDKVINSGELTEVSTLKNAPYTNDSNAHYWVYQRVC
jgi:2-polyprenyl-3-methyl-5-hydroxy-6-metoxy-1,4-benzoquinol methylase